MGVNVRFEKDSNLLCCPSLLFVKIQIVFFITNQKNYQTLVSNMKMKFSKYLQYLQSTAYSKKSFINPRFRNFSKAKMNIEEQRFENCVNLFLVVFSRFTK